MTSCHHIPKWHEWNVNANDVMMTWFTFFVNLVKSSLACASHMHIHSAHALIKYGTSKYLSGLVCIQANSNLGKLTASHFLVLYTQIANDNMPNMIPIAYHNKNLMDCNENLAWGK